MQISGKLEIFDSLSKLVPYLKTANPTERCRYTKRSLGVSHFAIFFLSFTDIIGNLFVTR